MYICSILAHILKIDEKLNMLVRNNSKAYNLLKKINGNI